MCFASGCKCWHFNWMPLSCFITVVRRRKRQRSLENRNNTICHYESHKWPIKRPPNADKLAGKNTAGHFELLLLFGLLYCVETKTKSVLKILLSGYYYIGEKGEGLGIGTAAWLRKWGHGEQKRTEEANGASQNGRGSHDLQKEKEKGVIWERRASFHFTLFLPSSSQSPPSSVCQGILRGAKSLSPKESPFQVPHHAPRKKVKNGEFSPHISLPPDFFAQRIKVLGHIFLFLKGEKIYPAFFPYILVQYVPTRLYRMWQAHVDVFPSLLRRKLNSPFRLSSQSVTLRLRIR